MSQVGQNRRHERNHRSKQNCAGQHLGPKEQNGRRNVCAIGITDCRHALRIEFITAGRGVYKIGQFVRAPDQVFFIEDTFSESPEKSRPAILENLAPRTEQRRGGIEIATERNHIVFIAAGSVQEQQGPSGRGLWRGNKTMDELGLAHGSRLFTPERVSATSIFCERFPLTARSGDDRLIPMHLWRKRIGMSWWRLRSEDLIERFGSSLAIIERPGAERLTLEISCETAREADKLVHEFGGSAERLRPGWLQDFARQARAKPLRIGSRLLILREPAIEALSSLASQARPLVIPAGAAFGTGEHATTALCLRLLERITRPLQPGWTLLDAGTGSGILAIAGGYFGARRVLAVDTDPLACATAKRNARANGVRNIEFSTGDILKEQLSGKFDIITANLFSEILIEALPIWVQHLAPDGHLILSGILRSQESAVVRALRRRRFTILEIPRRGKWIAVSVHRERNRIRRRQAPG
jgi:ribosomal protein L11 methyltransferase